MSKGHEALNGQEIMDLEEYDLEVCLDITTDEPEGVEINSFEDAEPYFVPCFCIQTIGDTSVGIYPFRVSPVFKGYKHLESWWRENGEEIIRLLLEEEYDRIKELRRR